MPDTLLSMLVVSSFSPRSHRLDIVREWMEWREREKEGQQRRAVVVVFVCRRFCRIREGRDVYGKEGRRRDRVCIHVMVSKRPQHCRVLAGTEPTGAFFYPLISRLHAIVDCEESIMFRRWGTVNISTKYNEQGVENTRRFRGTCIRASEGLFIAFPLLPDR